MTINVRTHKSYISKTDYNNQLEILNSELYDKEADIDMCKALINNLGDLNLTNDLYQAKVKKQEAKIRKCEAKIKDLEHERMLLKQLYEDQQKRNLEINEEEDN